MAKLVKTQRQETISLDITLHFSDLILYSEDGYPEHEDVMLSSIEVFADTSKDQQVTAETLRAALKATDGSSNYIAAQLHRAIQDLKEDIEDGDV